MDSQNLNSVSFLSLGPGDPELLTLKAVRTLREADVVVLPATKDETGRLTSRAADIVGQWCSKERTRLYEVPMLKERRAVRAVYDRMCRDIADAHKAGRRVAVAVEGDVSIYASIHYVLDRLQALGVPTEQQPGITSFIAAAALAQCSLVSRQERLTVLPGDADEALLDSLLANGHVVVVMKLSQCRQAVKRFIEQHDDIVCHYFENVGTASAFHTACRDDILRRAMPYFSLCILSRKA